MNYRMSLNIGPITHYGANGLYAPYTGGGGGGGGGSTVNIVASTLTVSSIATSAPDGVAFPNGLTTAGVAVTSLVGGQNNLSILVDNASVPQSTIALNFQAYSGGSGQNSLIGVAYNQMSITGHEELYVSFPGGEMSISTATVNVQYNLNVSSINGQAPGGGGGGVFVSTIGLPPNTTWGSGQGPVAIGPAFSTTVGKTYTLAFDVETVSTITPAVQGDKATFLIGADVLNTQALSTLQDFNLHQPRGFQVNGMFTASSAGTGISLYCNGGAPSTVITMATTGNLLLAQLD